MHTICKLSQIHRLLLDQAPGNDGSFPAGTHVGVMRRTYTLLRADFLHFVSFQISAAAILLLSLRKIFPTGRLKRNGYFSETKCPPERAGKPPKGSRRNSRDTGGEKTSGSPAWPAAKKTFARRDALRSCPQSGDRAAAAGCPRALKPRALRAEVPRPFCGSGPAGRGVDQGTRFYRSGPVRREASGARCEPAVGDVRSARAQLTADPGPVATLAIPVPCPPTAGRFHTGNGSPAGNCGPAPCHRYCHRHVPVPGQFFPCFFPWISGEIRARPVCRILTAQPATLPVLSPADLERFYAVLYQRP